MSETAPEHVPLDRAALAELRRRDRDRPRDGAGLFLLERPAVQAPAPSVRAEAK